MRVIRGFGFGELVDFDRVLYHRTTTGREIDFVGRDLNTVAIESKYIDGKFGRDMQTITRSPWFGILASRSVPEWHQDGWIIPAPILTLLLGE